MLIEWQMWMETTRRMKRRDQSGLCTNGPMHIGNNESNETGIRTRGVGSVKNTIEV